SPRDLGMGNIVVVRKNRFDVW
nr:immunoglobulin heavy chain junction region [Macaca mulatta]